MTPSRRGANFSQGYVPAFGDVVNLNWAPAAGYEMKGPHYGLALSATPFNHATGMVVLVPITSKRDKLSTLELEVRVGRVNGVALISGLRALDYTARDIQFEAKAPAVAGEANKRVAMFLPPS